MKQLVIGLGEIGSAIRNVLECDGHDIWKEVFAQGHYDVLHICFPYTKAFERLVQGYKEYFTADLVIIHSTVPIGTSEKLNSISSPIRGVHPHLEEGIKTFEKFFGGARSQEAAELFSKIGVKVVVTEDSRSVEAMKLWDTTIYGYNILLEKEIHRFCVENNLDFNTVYTQANRGYNEGYSALGMNQFQKYILKHKDGPIGGHCVVPNCYLLGSWVADLIIEKNKNYK